MRVDFHVHSTASDGTSSPSGIVAHAIRRGISFMALTDHDNVSGISEFLSSGVNGTARRFAGIELSIDPGDGFDTFHLLGLGIDPDAAKLTELLRGVRRDRDERNAAMIANFARLGIDMEGLRGNGEILARPHFAKRLVFLGFAKTILEAFEKYLKPDSPSETRCYESRKHPSQEDAIGAIHAAGGLAVMAHPKFWKRSWKTTGPDYTLAESGFAALREKGLDGVEALYCANMPVENVVFTRAADAARLLKTAGSDYHGKNKPSIPLGMDVSDSFIAPFLERITESMR